MTEGEYATWLAKEVRLPEWGSNPPPWPPGMMFGTCFNDECNEVMETEDVGIWRPEKVGKIVVMQALCRSCLAHQLDGEAADGDTH